MALRETYREALVAALAGFTPRSPRAARGEGEALGLLAGVHSRRPAWKGEWWAYHPALAPPLAKTEPWEGTPMALGALARRDRSTPTRASASRACEGLREVRAGDAAQRLRVRFREEPDPVVRRALVAALGEFRDEGSRGLIAAVLRDPGADPSLKAEALLAAAAGGGGGRGRGRLRRAQGRAGNSPLRTAAVVALGGLRYASAAPDLESLAAAGDDQTARAACEALANIGGDAGGDALLRLANRASPGIRRDAVAALGRLSARAAVPRLLAAYRDPEMRATALAALARMPDARALDAYLEGLGTKDGNLREACLKAIGRIRDEALPQVEARAHRLPSVVVAQLRAPIRVTPARPVVRCSPPPWRCPPRRPMFDFAGSIRAIRPGAAPVP